MNNYDKMIEEKDVEQFSVWRYLTQKERNYLIKKYDIKTFERLRELEHEAIRINIENSLKTNYKKSSQKSKKVVN